LVGLVQGLTNVRVTGNVNLVGRDLIHIHHHHHYATAESQVPIPPILRRVPNFRKIHIATLGKAAPGSGDWIYAWKEFCIWLASDGHIRILWGSGMRRFSLSFYLIHLTAHLCSGCWENRLCVRDFPFLQALSLTVSLPRSLVINAVEAHAHASATPVYVGFLYIRYSDSTGATVRDLLEVLVKQTLERHPDSFSLFNEVYGRHIREDTEPSKGEILGLLKRFTAKAETATFYFLDALDEAPRSPSRPPGELAVSQREIIHHLSPSENARRPVPAGPPFSDHRTG
jgi:hypothetical protein